MQSDDRIDAALDIARDRGEIGVQAGAYRDGALVVDAWAGTMLPGGSPVDGDTLFPILSATKAATAIAVHIQAERGLLDVDAPVADVWPEFAVNGKAAVTIRDVLSHRAGLAHLPPGTTIEALLDWDATVAAIARLEPWFEGSCNAYHPLGWGHILGEVVRRSDPAGRAFGAFVQDEICRPLGIADLWIGLPAEHHWRCSDVSASCWPLADPRHAPLRVAALPPSWGGPQAFQNRTDFRSGCVPAGNGIANARSLARLFAMLACGGAIDGVRLLSEQRVQSLLEPRPDDDERDAILDRVGRFGWGGFHIGHIPRDEAANPVVGSGAILWTFGGGGTYGWADLDNGFAAAICHNRLMTPVPVGDDHPFAPLAGTMREITP